MPYADLSDPQTLNLYGYVRNNPLSKDDPTGHCPPCIEALELLESPPAQAAIEKATPYVTAGLGILTGLVVAANEKVQEIGTKLITKAGEAMANMPQSGVPGLGGVDNPVPNAFMTRDRPGTLGKPDHQQTVKEEAARLNGNPEVKIDTTGGKKDSRRADAVGTNPETGQTEIVQVYRPTRAGNIPKREVDAAADIERATGIKPVMVPVRPVTPRVP